jgi:hypothetical protein
MTRISHINELYGGNEALERIQRRERASSTPA